MRARARRKTCAGVGQSARRAARRLPRLVRRRRARFDSCDALIVPARRAHGSGDWWVVGVAVRIISAPNRFARARSLALSFRQDIDELLVPPNFLLFRVSRNSRSPRVCRSLLRRRRGAAASRAEHALVALFDHVPHIAIVRKLRASTANTHTHTCLLYTSPSPRD